MRSNLPQCGFPNCERGKNRLVIAALLCPFAVLSACRHEDEFAPNRAARPLQVQSTSFTNGGSIPDRDTCGGANLSPALQWSVPPAETRSIAIVMHDPDALVDFTHWIVFNIPPGVQSLPEGASENGMPQGSMEGTNDFDQAGYGGPCPPGSKPHRYLFHVYALDIRPNLPAGVNRKRLDSRMNGHILAAGEIEGIYRRSGQ